MERNKVTLDLSGDVFLNRGQCLDSFDYYLIVDNEGSDSDFSDKESDIEPMKEDKQESEDFSETHGLVFEPDNFPGRAML
jgi:hypothetical protein